MIALREHPLSCLQHVPGSVVDNRTVLSTSMAGAPNVRARAGIAILVCLFTCIVFKFCYVSLLAIS